MSDEQSGKNELLAQDERVLSRIEIDQDNAFQNNLILLISKLEQLMVRLEKANKQPVVAIGLLSEVVNRVVEFSETLQRAGVEALPLSKALTGGHDKYPMLRLLHTQKNRLSVQTAANLFNGWAGDMSDRQDVFRQICQGMISILESYFLLFAGYFWSSLMRDRWRETHSVFLFDLKQAIDKIQF